MDISRREQLAAMKVGEKLPFLAEGYTASRLMKNLWVEMTRVGYGKWVQKEVIGIHAKSKEVFAIVVVERVE